MAFNLAEIKVYKAIMNYSTWFYLIIIYVYRLYVSTLFNTGTTCVSCYIWHSNRNCLVLMNENIRCQKTTLVTTVMFSYYHARVILCFNLYNFDVKYTSPTFFIAMNVDFQSLTIGNLTNKIKMTTHLLTIRFPIVRIYK